MRGPLCPPSPQGLSLGRLRRDGACSARGQNARTRPVPLSPRRPLSPGPFPLRVPVFSSFLLCSRIFLGQLLAFQRALPRPLAPLCVSEAWTELRLLGKPRPGGPAAVSLPWWCRPTLMSFVLFLCRASAPCTVDVAAPEVVPTALRGDGAESRSNDLLIAFKPPLFAHFPLYGGEGTERGRRGRVC